MIAIRDSSLRMRALLADDRLFNFALILVPSTRILQAPCNRLGQSPRIDILVNDAGYLGAYRPFHELDAGEWRKIVEVNLIGVFEASPSGYTRFATCHSPLVAV